MPISDLEIKQRIEDESLIENAQMENIQTNSISWGLSASGYDLRCGYDFKVAETLRPPENRVWSYEDVYQSQGEFYDGGYALNPKNPNPDHFEDVQLRRNEVLILLPGEYALTHAIEKINMPRDLVAVVLGKSTYARNLIIVNMTPLESEWSGYPTIEIANVGPMAVMIYPGEGICQILFFEIQGKVGTSYADRKGKYQNQLALEMLSRVK